MKALHITPLVLMSAGVLFAQTAVPSAPKEQPIELSPIVITETADNGYAATETLSGTRLRTAAKDVPAALSIISADMLSDLGALDFNDVLNFLPSTAVYANNAGDLDDNGPRTGTPFTVRGFRSDSLTTNFFNALTSIDTYNTKRLTFSRGPNSLVFGVGNPGGGLDIETNVPDLRKNFGSVEFRGDTFGSNRVAVDANGVLVPGKVGLRFDALQQDLRNYITPEKRERTSFYLASTFHPFEGTRITLEGETTKIRMQIGQSTAPYDGYTPWALAGSPIRPVFGVLGAVPGITYQSATGYLVAISGQSAIAPTDWSNSAFSSNWVVNGANALRVSFKGSPVVPLNTNILGNGDQVNVDSSNATLLIQQTFWKKLSIEVAGKFEHQYLYNFQGATGTDTTVRIDPNAQLPNGQPNPYVGRPYVDTSGAFYISRPTNDAQARATASYELDLNRWKVFGRNLGTLAFATLYSYERLHQTLDNFRLINLTPLRTTGTLGNLNNAANNIHNRTYLVPGQDYFNVDWTDPINSGGIHSGWARVRATPRDNLTYTDADSGLIQAKLLDDLLVFTGGMRSDRVLLGSALYTQSSLGVFPDIAHSSSTLEQRSRDTTYSVGAVLNATKWLSLFANKATNFVPSNQSTVTINRSSAPPTEGQGYDFGLRFNFFGGKVQGSIDRFSSSQSNILDNTLTANNMTAAISAIWQAIDPNRDPGTWGDFQTQRTIGTEYQLVGNPTPNLRLMLTASQNKPTVADRGALLFAYVNANLPTWQSNANTPVNTTLGTNVAAMIKIINTNIANDKATIGIGQTDVYQWHFSGTARYLLPGEGWWKGLAVGGTFYSLSRPTIGFHVLPGTANFDVTQPFYGSETLNVGAFVDYSRYLLHKRIRWDTQLRVQNLLDDRTAKPWTALDDGSGGRFVVERLMPNAIGGSISTKFSF